MSIRTNPMKAVPTLLKRFGTVEKKVDLKDLKSELIKIKDLFSTVKKNEEELLDTLTVVDGYLRNSNIQKLMEEKEEICKRIRNSTQKLLPAAAIQSGNTEAAESSGKTFQVVNGAVSSSPQLKDLAMLEVNYNRNDPDLRIRFLSLLVFPENAVINKRNAILYLESVTSSYGGIDLGEEDMLNELLSRGLIVRHDSRWRGVPKGPIVSKFKMNPRVHQKVERRRLLQNEELPFELYSQIIAAPRHACLVLDQLKVKLSDGFGFKSSHWRSVVNVGASYLTFGPQWMAKMKRLEMLHLGRWHDSASHHIEVESEEFLKELRDQEYLKYLSLRGISQIFKLPPSVFQLESLETLDLKACHNLVTLPDDIASLRKLRYLNLSQCYLLDRMPKGIEKLTRLEVLKGFVLSSSSKTPCRISDLANLINLKRLSIHIGSGAVIQDREFESLKELSELEHLKISWGVSEAKYSDIQIILPSSLTKLHLEGYPGQEIPRWLKTRELLRGLEELKISGGKLKSLNHGMNNYVSHLEIVRLKYIKHLEVDLTDLQERYPNLKYAEIKQIQNHSYLEWSIDEES